MTKKDELLEPINNTSTQVQEHSQPEIESKKEKVARDALLKELERIPEIDKKINTLLQQIDDPTKLGKASVKDIAVALGILADKRQAALDSSVGKKQPNISMRIAWKGGEGAVELKTGGE